MLRIKQVAWAASAVGLLPCVVLALCGKGVLAGEESANKANLKHGDKVVSKDCQSLCLKHESRVQCMAISPDNKKLVCASFYGLYL